MKLWLLKKFRKILPGDYVDGVLRAKDDGKS
jgi:Flp pilus assembly protein CpaB